MTPSPARAIFRELARLTELAPVTRTTISECEAALRSQAGIPAHAAKLLGISRQALCERIGRSARLQKAVEEIEATKLDMAEGNVSTGLAAGDGQYTRWYLDRKGAARGYAPKSQLVGKGGEPVDLENLLAQLSPDELATINALRARARSGSAPGSESDL